MAEIRIKVNVEDIEKIVLGANPSEEVRLQLRHDVLSAYAEKYIKGIEHSPAFQEFKKCVEQEVNKQLREYATHLTNCQRVLNDDMKRLIAGVVKETFGDMYRTAVAEQRELYEKSVKDATAAYKISQDSIIAAMNKMADIPDVKTLIHETYVNTLRTTMREFIANRSLRELEECAMGKEK
jgi:hypothetical protein